MDRADLHLHSNFSDGSDSVAELMSKIEKSDVNIFSLTDHDTCFGCIEAVKLIPEGKKFVAGIELTCTLESVKCHILGYGYDVFNVELHDLIEKGKRLRRQKLDTRIEYLSKVWNIDLTKDELDWLYSRKSVVKTHLANILVKRGLAENNVLAMKKYLDACKTGNTRFDGEEAISVLKKAGAVVVWAHPLGGEGERHLSPEEFQRDFDVMKTHGINGLECFYSRYNFEESEFLCKVAEKEGLFVSGGSDYHGLNKENIEIGQLNTLNKPVDAKNLTLLRHFNY